MHENLMQSRNSDVTKQKIPPKFYVFNIFNMDSLRNILNQCFKQT